jgi:outer membrane cobalamin receptor
MIKFRKTWLVMLAFAMMHMSNINAQTALDSTSITGEIPIYELSLEELLKVKVILATKNHKENFIAPASITSYTNDEIEILGQYTLKDLANITPGYSTFSAFGETNIETRGQKADSWNTNKHVLLIDGIPVNHARANSAPLEYQAPLFFADRVEFLKGPGSALYGTSAFYGAIYIQPQDLKKNETQAKLRLSSGTMSNTQQILGNVVVKKPLGQLSLHVGYYKRGFSGDSIGVPNTDALYDNDNSFFVYSRFKANQSFLKGITLGTIYMRKQSHGGEFWGGPVSPHNLLSWEYLIPYIKYERPLRDNFWLYSFVKYNASVESAMTHAGRANRVFRPSSVPGRGYNITVSNIETQTELHYNISDQIQLIGGINYDSRKELGSPTSYGYEIAAPSDTSGSDPVNYQFNYLEHSPSLRVNLLSTYGQYQHKLDILNGLHITLGARYDIGYSSAGQYDQLSPRFALVQSLNKQLTVKFLYGKALLVPGVKEYMFNEQTKNLIEENGGIGDPNDIPDPKAESFGSFEGILEFTHKSFNIQFNGFFNKNWGAMAFDQYSFIDAKGENIVYSYFVNSASEVKTRGFEAGIKLRQSSVFQIHLSHAMAQSMLNDTTYIVNVPTQKTDCKAFVSIKNIFPVKAGISYRYVWGYRVGNEYSKDLLDISNKNILSGFQMLNLNLIFPVTSYLNIELQGINLLGSTWKQPSLKGQTSMVPLPKRQLIFSLLIKL